TPAVTVNTPTTLPPTIPVPTLTLLPAKTPSPTPTEREMAMPTDKPSTGETRIRVIIGDTVLTGRLWDNATARDLIDQLPLTLTFRDFNRVEKITTLPRRLSTEGMPPGDDPLPGDIGYYAPWNNLVFYYGDVGYFNGIVRIGRFEGNVEFIANQTGDFTAIIEIVR
ncbi:MAG: cyclophilin-like fold protein, partial [Anaerolineae bacterium]|nr:cyclophilin-like fold protein [Thermoflexales bacterium]MDW8408176.1 cyclophilin-like fold protein [Anaerolineae bacterium]